MKKNRLFLVVALLLCLSVKSQQLTRLTELDLSHLWQEYGKVQIGKSVTGEDAVVNGQSFQEVIGTHAQSRFKIDLKGDAIRFRSLVGVAESEIDISDSRLVVVPLVDGTKIYFRNNAEQKQFVGFAGAAGRIERGSVRFILKGDAQQIYDSGVVREGDAPRQIDVELKGVRILELIVEPTQDGASGDNALWIAPTVEYKSLQPEAVDAGYVGEGPKQSVELSQMLSHKIGQLPVFDEPVSTKTNFDWLLTPERSKAGVYASSDRKSIIVANAMVARTFRIFPNLATVALTNRMTGESMLRAVSGEGMVQIDGKRRQIGGLDGQPERGYLKSEWVDQMVTIPESFLLEDFEIVPIQEKIKWARSRWASSTEVAKGTEIVFTLRGDKELKDVLVKLHVSIYDQIPVIRKRFQVVNNSSLPINIDTFQLEYLAFAEPESPGGGDPSKFILPNIHIESDYACGGGFTEDEADITEKWVTDPAYTSQRNYLLQTKCVLDVSPKLGPDYSLKPNGIFSSFSVYEMPFDSDDRERKGLFMRKMYRALAPWTTENPIFMHLTSTKPEVVYRAIDQCVETGYEMVILSFGSGLNAEDISDANIAKFKAFVDYAKKKGIEMGCYSLLASRWISDDVDVINPKTGKPGGMIFGSSPCLSSEWGHDYFTKIKTFFEKTGMRCFEHDGSYPGDFCASDKHVHHKGLNDSQWNQFDKITELYHWMCEQGIYINVPDFYFLNGSTKVGIGYREANWSLPRERQLIHTRQLNYDCTWERIPSSMWSFVPLVEYQGGGAEATLEPLSEHLYEYKTLMMQNYGAGIQACYRGPRLYDTPQTKEVVIEVIQWYKKYRTILNSDIIHLRRPDAKDWDGLMHADPEGAQKGLAMFFNPTDSEIVRSIKLPLYYTGLKQKAKIREQEGKIVSYNLSEDFTVNLTVKIPARGYTWYVIE